MKNVILFTWFFIVLCVKLRLFGRNGVSQKMYSVVCKTSFCHLLWVFKEGPVEI